MSAKVQRIHDHCFQVPLFEIRVGGLKFPSMIWSWEKVCTLSWFSVTVWNCCTCCNRCKIFQTSSRRRAWLLDLANDAILSSQSSFSQVISEGLRLSELQKCFQWQKERVGTKKKKCNSSDAYLTSMALLLLPLRPPVRPPSPLQILKRLQKTTSPGSPFPHPQKRLSLEALELRINSTANECSLLLRWAGPLETKLQQIMLNKLHPVLELFQLLGVGDRSR